MSNVCVPIDPVLPSNEILFTFPFPSGATFGGTSARPGQHAP